MEEIPAMAVITFAVTAFIISAVSATGLYLNDVARADSLDRAKDMFAAVSSYGPLLVEGRSGHLSAEALERVSDGTLMVDIKNVGDMRVTVTERGPSAGGGNGTLGWTFGTTNRTDPSKATVTGPVLVGRLSNEPGPDHGTVVFHIAVLEVRTW